MLQKEARVAVWGTSSGGTGSAVQLSLDGMHVARVTVAANGTWSAHLPPQKVSWAVTLAASNGVSTASEVVKFGHVVMCSGQVCRSGGQAATQKQLHAARGWRANSDVCSPAAEQHGYARVSRATWLLGIRRSDGD